jgi:1-deoxy-D-xylulose-5-phosphate reductoisomerase
VVNPRSVTILGATGSIGQATLDVVESQKDELTVEAVVSGRDVAALAAAAKRVKARLAVVADDTAYGTLRDALAGTGIEAAAGAEAVVEAAMRPVDWTMAAIVGTAGLRASHAAALRGGTLALATKECIVSAGTLFMEAAKRGQAILLPVDSEHNAIFQALAGADIADVAKITLTASGGPFRTWPAERMASVRPEDALRHPTWQMGSKITIDSATMMNKGLELIEARYLFAIEEERLEVLVHPQSIVHGLVAYRDGSVTAGLAPADMRVAIAHTLGHPRRIQAVAQHLDLVAVGTLTFEAPDPVRFPALDLARSALRRGKGAETVLNAANEVAVAAFLDGRIGFTAIAETVGATLEAMDRAGELHLPSSLAEVLVLDELARRRARERLPTNAGRSFISGKVAT